MSDRFGCEAIPDIAHRLVNGVVIEQPICVTGRHERHRAVPWLSGEPYARPCSIKPCEQPAAYELGADLNLTLCDCHAEDWFAFNDRFPEYIHDRPESVSLREAGLRAWSQFAAA